MILSKGLDRVCLLEQLGSPPEVPWLTLGSTSNARRREVKEVQWARVAVSLEAGEALVEIAGRSSPRRYCQILWMRNP